MTSRQKKLLFAFVGIVFLGLLITPYLGEARSLEIKYPKLLGMENRLTSKSSLSDYLSYLYYFAINIIGIAAFVIVVVGGISYLTAAGSLEKTRKAQKQLIGGSTGLLIVLGTFLILRTINPQLLVLQEPNISTLHGVCLFSNYEQEDEEEHCFIENTLKILPEDFQPDTIALYGLSREFDQVFLFPEENYQGTFRNFKNLRKLNDDPAQVVRNLAFIPQSIYFDDHESGVFLFPNSTADYDQDSFQDFPNNLPVILKTWIGDLGDFNDRTKSIEMRYSYNRYFATNTKENPLSAYPDVFYGIMAQEDTGAKGRCALAYKGGQFSGPSGIYPRWITNLDSDFDLKPPGGISRVRSIQVWNRKIQGDLAGSVTFYDAIDTPDNTGHKWTISAAEIQNGMEPYFWHIDSILTGSSKWHDLSQILSIKIEGNYWVMVSNKADWQGGCQTFSKDVPNLKDQYILQLTMWSDLSWMRKIRSIAIVPVVPPLE